ncbi:UdgX family uracil-DNA binding protein [Lacipirellula sp.]|uniref:UdgX family uracil-DNA binding protein n=1 Tax=Lacipirellula sp. TaxID=2691419 RepID=UPI003D0E9930
MRVIEVEHFEAWRAAARELLRDGVPAGDVDFCSPSTQKSLFGDESDDGGRALAAREAAARQRRGGVTVPPDFLKRARMVACHRDEHRWNLLYRVLWRLTTAEPNLLHVAFDDDVRRFDLMAKSVGRDAHKAQAFVRFRRIETEDGEQFVAWHRPDHRILRLVGPFFSRRFKSMRWTILTPDESASWDGAALTYGPGAPASAAPSADDLDEMWRSYYRSIFNPARIKLAMMRREMPVRYWAALPETQIIPEILAEAPARVAAMLKYGASGTRAVSAAEFLPEARDLESLARAAAGCRGCELCERATQTVFGRGPSTARLVLVGEQPGDQEDRHGEPFIGPAGEVLNHALVTAGLARDEVYLTNAVKHFHWEPRGKQRLHKKPPSRAISACRPWLEAEMTAVAPRVLVCLGVTAAQAVLGRDTRALKTRGVPFASEWCERTIITWHPAASLRARTDEERRRIARELAEHLRVAACA